jgi:hypothetical protein
MIEPVSGQPAAGQLAVHAVTTINPEGEERSVFHLAPSSQFHCRLPAAGCQLHLPLRTARVA